MHILAHRGLWLAPDDKNSSSALRRAFDAGFGVETDVRDHLGELVISHDPPLGTSVLPFHHVVSAYLHSGSHEPLAINIKADGLHEQLAAAIAALPPGAAFVFDMSVPDALGYLERGVPTFTRQSEYESTPAFYDQAVGVWLDSFHDEWVSPSIIETHLRAHRRVALVSPELHGRDHRETWRRWREALRDPAAAAVMLCTDHPEEARTFFDASD